jgi:putative membrane-bound dehydrogenase-like protein
MRPSAAEVATEVLPPLEPLAGFTLPDGFEITQFADDDLATNIYTLTTDPRGEVVVGGPGYVKVLHDDNGDGRADRATLYTDQLPNGPQGMEFAGENLLCVANEGVICFRDEDADGQADGSAELWVALDKQQGGEHDAHAIRKGPDGWFYLIAGNNAGVTNQLAQLPTSPVKEPIQGVLVAIRPDGSGTEILAHGYRNAYDFDFHPGGQMFTYDSDGERDNHLPWYAPTRVFDVAVGRHHGWLLPGWVRSWNRPTYFFDNVDRAAETGRGSPTGVEFYRHRRFPPKYRGGLFLACWTYGRIYFCPLRPEGATYRSEPEVFLQAEGTAGFAPVDLVVGPEGDLFVAIGGRSTRGGVFRIRYLGRDARPAEPGLAAETPPLDTLTRILQADQPLSSWSRACWEPLAAELGADPFRRAAISTERSAAERIRAIEVLTEHFGGLPLDVARRLAVDADARVVARVAWALSRIEPAVDSRTRVSHGSATEAAAPGAETTEAARRGDLAEAARTSATETVASVETQSLIATLTGHPAPLVQRTAWEALVRQAFVSSHAAVRPAWETAAMCPDRRVRAAMVAVARGPGAENFRRYARLPAETRAALSRLRIAGFSAANRDAYVDTCLAALRDTEERELRLEAVRLLQIALGDICHEQGQRETDTGYAANSLANLTPEQRSQVAAVLVPSFPSGHADLDREMARLLGMLRVDDPTLLAKLADRLTDDSHPSDDVHYLLVMAQLPGEREAKVTAGTAAALVAVDHKMDELRLDPSRNWPLRIAEAVAELCGHDPNLAAAIVRQPDFGLAAHGVYARRLPDEQRSIAARVMLDRSEDEDEEYWTVDLVRLVAELPPDESLPVLRDLCYDVSLRDAIVPVLAQSAEPQDRRLFVRSLNSTQLDTFEAAAGALIRLDGAASREEYVAALRTLRTYCADRRFKRQRGLLNELLSVWSGERQRIVEPAGGDVLAVYQPWFDWFADFDPEAAEQISGFGGAAGATWRRRLAQIPWDQGDAVRGETVFRKTSCSRCHLGKTRLGPDLGGITNRFDKFDLFAAIVDPNKDISPLYQTTVVMTEDGKMYQGQVVYISPASTLLRSGLNETIRIAGPRITSTRTIPQSPMPEGLLNESTDRDLSDLYAYLETL